MNFNWDNQLADELHEINSRLHFIKKKLEKLIPQMEEKDFKTSKLWLLIYAIEDNFLELE